MLGAMSLIALILMCLAYANCGRRLHKILQDGDESNIKTLHLQHDSAANAKDLLKAFLWAQARTTPAVRGIRRAAATARDPFALTMAADSNLPRVAVIGRPNVGKSTLYNALKGVGDSAIVFDKPGVTRDCMQGRGETFSPTKGEWVNYTIVDTGGLVLEDVEGEIFLKEIRETAVGEITKADAIIFVVDGQAGPTGLDEDLALYLRKTGKPIFLAVNKCESYVKGDQQAYEFNILGLGIPYPVSAMTSLGLYDLMEDVVEAFPDSPRKKVKEKEYKDEIRIAFLGRPNSGKSSLLNKLTNTNRSIVSDLAGTTVDAIDQDVVRDGVKFTFIDTAGVRKRTSVSKGIEEAMVKRSFKSVRRADVAILVVDAIEGVAEQEQRLAKFINQNGVACLLVVNKWDLVPEKDDRLYKDSKKYILSRLSDISYANPLFISAKTGVNTRKIFDEVKAAVEQYRRRVPTAVLNEALEDALRWQKPPSTKRGKQGAIYYGAQVSTEPPAITVFCNDPKLFSKNYERYLLKQLRACFGFSGTPLRLFWKGKSKREVMRGA